MAVDLGLSTPLSTLVSRKYATAKESGDLLFSPTVLTTISAVGVPFQLRYCPALAKKPTQHQCDDASKPKKRKPNPFSDPPASLLISQLPANTNSPSHVLVLNKFPVIPSHFILATKRYKKQTDLLDADDLAATYACLKAWEDSDSSNEEDRNPRNLFAFFNSGPHSGASQPHRHIQFLPVEEMVEQTEDPSLGVSQKATQATHDASSDLTKEAEWSLLINKMVHSSSAKKQKLESLFQYFSTPIPGDPSPLRLFDEYRSLYNQAVESCQNFASTHPGNSNIFSPIPANDDAEDEAEFGEPAKISYNLGLTTSAMILCPRRREGTWLWADDHQESSLSPHEPVVGEGEVALNGTILAGTLMVKTEHEFQELQDKRRLLEKVLVDVGIPPVLANSTGSQSDAIEVGKKRGKM